MRHRSTLHVRSGQVVLPFLLGYQLVKGEMGCLLLDYDLVWLSITRYIVDKLMLSACVKLEHD
jgi:hypothetical protein